MRLLLLTAFIGLQTSAARPAPQAQAAVTVTVRPQSEVAGQSVILSDIADVTGADKALASRIAAVEVGTSPLIGLSRTLMKADIITRLRFNKIDISQVEVVSAPSVKVTRVGAEVPVPEVVEFALSSLKATRKEPQDGLQIEPLSTPYKWVVPPGKRDYQSGPIRGGLEASTATVPVTVMVDGKPVKTVEISFRIRKLTAVLVATRQLEAHAIVKPEDVSLATQEVTPGTVALTDSALVIGSRTTRQITSGAVITKSSVESAPVITIGAAVDVRVVIGGISVATAGVARSQGAVGDRIRVFIPKTNKEISATVVDSRTVNVEENG